MRLNTHIQSRLLVDRSNACVETLDDILPSTLFTVMRSDSECDLRRLSRLATTVIFVEVVGVCDSFLFLSEAQPQHYSVADRLIRRLTLVVRFLRVLLEPVRCLVVYGDGLVVAADFVHGLEGERRLCEAELGVQKDHSRTN